MNQDICLDVSMSYSDTDVWIAKDVHELIFEYGFFVYCAERQPDYARGSICKKFFDIYSDSRIDVIFWSHHLTFHVAKSPTHSIISR